MTECRRVAVVGTGLSGIASIKTALDYGWEPIAFEQLDDIGGLWRYKPNETEESSVMKSTVINVSKEMMAYSDFPPPATFSVWMHNTEMLEYIRGYAKQFGLLPYIRFHHKVQNIRRSSDYATTGRWIVEYIDAYVWISRYCESSFSDGIFHSEIFDAALLANGHHRLPYWPEPWPGQDIFQGRIIHSHSYKNARGYEDKVVVVVGLGQSAIDSAIELSRIAKRVYLSTRRGSWIIGRMFDNGYPADMACWCRWFEFRHSTIESVNKFFEAKANARFDHERYGLKPAHRYLGAHPTVSDDLHVMIASGLVRIKPSIQEFTENGVIFVDGTSVEDVDEVIMATGYSVEIPPVENGTLIPVHENETMLYKHMYPIETSDHNTFAVIGLLQVIGSLAAVAEMQARLFFNVLSGETQLPNKAAMLSEMRSQREALRSRCVLSRRHTFEVSYGQMMDELGAMIGARVSIFRLAFSDPVLAYRCFFGPNLPYCYRLTGPHQWSGARTAILNVETRITEGFRRSPRPAVAQLMTTEASHSKGSCTIVIAILTGAIAVLLLFRYASKTFR